MRFYTTTNSGIILSGIVVSLDKFIFGCKSGFQRKIYCPNFLTTVQHEPPAYTETKFQTSTRPYKQLNPLLTAACYPQIANGFVNFSEKEKKKSIIIPQNGKQYGLFRKNRKI